MGRPPKLRTDADRRIAELEAELDRMKKVVTASQVREELALAMPFLAQRRKLTEELERLRGEKSAGRGRPRAAESGSAGGAPDEGEPAGGEARRTDEDGDVRTLRSARRPDDVRTPRFAGSPDDGGEGDARR
jgi:hypothetical protein